MGVTGPMILFKDTIGEQIIQFNLNILLVQIILLLPIYIYIFL